MTLPKVQRVIPRCVDGYPKLLFPEHVAARGRLAYWDVEGGWDSISETEYTISDPPRSNYEMKYFADMKERYSKIYGVALQDVSRWTNEMKELAWGV